MPLPKDIFLNSYCLKIKVQIPTNGPQGSLHLIGLSQMDSAPYIPHTPHSTSTPTELNAYQWPCNFNSLCSWSLAFLSLEIPYASCKPNRLTPLFQEPVLNVTSSMTSYSILWQSSSLFLVHIPWLAFIKCVKNPKVAKLKPLDQ